MAYKQQQIDWDAILRDVDIFEGTRVDYGGFVPALTLLDRKKQDEMFSDFVSILEEDSEEDSEEGVDINVVNVPVSFLTVGKKRKYSHLEGSSCWAPPQITYSEDTIYEPTETRKKSRKRLININKLVYTF